MDWLTSLLDVGTNAATGGLVGAGLRLVPDVISKIIGVFTSKRDQDHEFRMAKLQLDIANQAGEQKIREVDAEGSWAAQAKQMEAWVEAIKGQSQMTGVRFIDAANQSVRPFTTYYFLALYGFAKLAAVAIATFSPEVGAQSALALLWTPADMQMLCGILGFWYVDRQLGKTSLSK